MSEEKTERDVSDWDGRPQNPEHDGWHWLKYRDGSDSYPYHWTSGDEEQWDTDGDYSIESMARQCIYIAPCAPLPAGYHITPAAPVSAVGVDAQAVIDNVERAFQAGHDAGALDAIRHIKRGWITDWTMWLTKAATPTPPAPAVRDDGVRVEAAARALGVHDNYPVGWENWLEAARAALAAADAVAGAGRSEALTAADYEEAMASHRALVCRLDVAMNGDGAAKQASLCDIVDQLEKAIKAAGAVRDGDALDAAPRYRHKKRGTEYVVLGEAGLQTEQPLVDGDRLVVYCGTAGDLWARPPHEFHDGRFNAIAADLAPPTNEQTP